jgi:hypothetical protein
LLLTQKIADGLKTYSWRLALHQILATNDAKIIENETPNVLQISQNLCKKSGPNKSKDVETIARNRTLVYC